MSVRLLFMIIAVSFLTSCGSKELAPVVQYGQTSGAGSAGMHNVTDGDTLYSISNRYRLPMRDIVVLNHMSPPFKLYVGQRVRLPPPQEYKVQHGDTLYGVSRLFGVNSSEVARLNNIGSPYALKVGQVLRLPSVTAVSKVAGGVETSSGINVLPVSKTALAEEEPETVLVSKPLVVSEGFPSEGVPISQEKSSMVKTDTSSIVATAEPQPIKITKVTTKTPKRASSKFLQPVQGKIISDFGVKKSGLHNDGINILAARGTPVKAADNGVVVYAGNAMKASGNLILVRHENQWMTAYAHLDSIGVRKGQVVKRGELIGKVGSTGSVATPQLHFEVRRGTSALNPSKYLQ